MKHMWSEEEISSQKKDIAMLVDSKGNPRFIEGEGTPATIEGFTSTYCKWSLSGTHLMFVCAGTFANATEIDNNVNIATYILPKWIGDKIFAVWDSRNIETKTLTCIDNVWTTQTMQATLVKNDSTTIQIRKSGGGTFTLTATRSFRIQFDLLIDSE